MPSFRCPKDHESADPDFCSVCGARIPPATELSAACPDCGAKREPATAIFCEICGFNFSTGTHGELRPAPPAAVPAIPRWEVIVSVDPTLAKAESPHPPGGFDPLTIPLVNEATLIGRQSERRAIHPDICLDQDDAISHRHALLTRSSDGTLTLRDVGSVNGVILNGNPVPTLTDVPLHDGDVFTLGHWTSVRVKASS